MNRKEMLRLMTGFVIAGSALTSVGLVLPTLAAEQADDEQAKSRRPKEATSFVPKRISHSYEGSISASPERVFPLLCPIREYEWLDDWRCRMVYSDSGVAEENCIFETDFGHGPVTWTVNRYEPPRRIEFVIFAPGRQVERLKISLEPIGSNTTIRWERMSTGLSAAGNETAGHWRADLDKTLTEKIEYFLKNGRMKRLNDGE